ncbi:MAG: hypothetical protein GTO63_00295 [Anaerolineae bacterium]|nr:hypothetical protein [Anaerolineae bacterium]NIN93438.1 hypothetical protein [Anaerolineae bacterium]NIQ76800.1 hypothetical protein [Anaerolineae bacterium]
MIRVGEYVNIGDIGAEATDTKTTTKEPTFLETILAIGKVGSSIYSDIETARTNKKLAELEERRLKLQLANTSNQEAQNAILQQLALLQQQVQKMPDDTKPKENGLPWTTIALVGGGVVVLGLGAYLLLRK